MILLHAVEALKMTVFLYVKKNKFGSIKTIIECRKKNIHKKQQLKGT